MKTSQPAMLMESCCKLLRQQGLLCLQEDNTMRLWYALSRQNCLLPPKKPGLWSIVIVAMMSIMQTSMSGVFRNATMLHLQWYTLCCHNECLPNPDICSIHVLVAIMGCLTKVACLDCKSCSRLHERCPALPIIWSACLLVCDQEAKHFHRAAHRSALSWLMQEGRCSLWLLAKLFCWA